MRPTMRPTMLRYATALAWLGATFCATPALADAIDDLEPGQWLEIPGSQMREVCPANTASYDWHFYCQNVTLAWGGATLDTTRGRLVVWGGGHADYQGNEVYVFDMTSLSWSRVWGPSAEADIPFGGTHEVYDDGNPGSRHTYSGLTYVPGPVDALIAMGGALWQSGSYGVGTWSFGFGTGAWSRKTDGPGEQGYGDPSVYDPVTGHVFRRANSRVLEYDPVADTFTPRAESNGGFWQTNVATALAPEARLMVIVGDGRLDLYHLDTDQYEQDVPIDGASVADLFGNGSPGLDFDSSQQKFVLWNGGLDVYELDPVARSFSLHAGAGADPGPVTTSGGVFGRFRYVPSRNVFIRLNHVDENVFAFRLGPGTGTPLPADAGAGGSTGTGGSSAQGGATGTGAGSAGGTGGAAAPTANAASPVDDSGCGCTSLGRAVRAPARFLSIPALLLLGLRTRRARGRRAASETRYSGAGR